MNRINKKLIYEKSIVLAFIVFCAALIINNLLETEIIVALFDGAGKLFNTGLEKLNLFCKINFAEHPYFRIPPLESPVTPEDLERISPWMWIRGYLVSSVSVSSLLTFHFVSKMKFNKIITVSFITSVLSFALFTYTGWESASFIDLLQKNITGFFCCIFTCMTGFLFGTIYSLYFLKTFVKVNYKDQPNVFIKLMSGDD